VSHKRRDYTKEFKEQVLAECQQIGNVALVARRHGISASTVHTWRAAFKKRGSIEPLPGAEAERLNEMARRINDMSIENDMLKKLLAEKELELAVLRDLGDISNPR
jgi:transposase